jgi:hypothetical protein
MTHPDDLLADHVDGTLSEHERAVVDAHLQTCARCREEVDLARRAVRALGELEEVPVPTGVTGRVVAEARAAAPAKTARRDPNRRLAGLAAAAVIVGVIAIALTRGGGPSNDLAAEGAAATAGGGRSQLEKSKVPLEEQRDVNYDGEDGVLVLAQEVIAQYRRTAADTAATGDSGTGDATAAAPAATLSSGAQFGGAERTLADAGPAIRCFEQQGVPPAGADMVLRRLVEAQYLGKPAYIAVFLQGPGAGQSPDRAVVWVLSRKDCHIEHFQNVGFDSPEAGGAP